MGARAQPGLRRGNGLNGLDSELGMTLGWREQLDVDLRRPDRRATRSGEHQRNRDRQGERQKCRQENEEPPPRDEPLPGCAPQPAAQGQARRCSQIGVGGGRHDRTGRLRIGRRDEGGAAEVAA